MRVQAHRLAVDGDDRPEVEIVGQVTLVEMVGQSLRPFSLSPPGPSSGRLARGPDSRMNPLK
jgi:hypothetical protein